jgi:hypothetical protein
MNESAYDANPPLAAPAAQVPPTGAEAQLQWLVDRAAIGDLVVNLLSRIDAREYAAIAAMFTEDGVIELPFASYRPAELAEISERLFAPFEATHHMMGNLAIEIDGDLARSRQYLYATHVPDAEDPSVHADVGGWYDFRYRRVGGAWKLTHYELTFVFSDGIPFEPATP